MWLLLLAGCEKAPHEGTFEALTYNVAGLPEGISGSHPETNTPIIAPLLDPYGLVLVQEDFFYHDALDAGARHPYRTDPQPPRERPAGDGLNLFSDFPLGDVDRVQWDECNGVLDGASDCLAEKGFLFTEIALAEDLSLVVVDHHAEAGGGPADAAARAAGFEQMATYLDEHAAGRAVLVGGDTNLHGGWELDEPILLDFLDATGTADACRALECGDEHIDRFMFRGGDDLLLEPITWEVAEEFVDSAGEALSDHPAIHVGFRWSLP